MGKGPMKPLWPAAVAVVALATLTGVGSSAAQEYTARVDIVRLSVGVFDPQGGIVPKLSLEDFRVYENDVLQPIDFMVGPRDSPLVVALVIDASGSMGVAWADVERAARQFLSSLQPRDCAFVLPFSSRVGPGRWGRQDEGWDAFVDELDSGGGTPLHESLVFALRTLEMNAHPPAAASPGSDDRPRAALAAAPLQPPSISRVSLLAALERQATRVGGAIPAPTPGGCAPMGLPGNAPVFGGEARRAVVVLSDGRAGGSGTTLQQVVETSRSTMFPIFPVIIGKAGGGGADRMISIARDTGGLVVEARGAAELFAAFDTVMGFLDATYVLAYRPPSTSAVSEEWYDLRVELVGHPEVRPVHAPAYLR